MPIAVYRGNYSYYQRQLVRQQRLSRKHQIIGIGANNSIRGPLQQTTLIRITRIVAITQTIAIKDKTLSIASALIRIKLALAASPCSKTQKILGFSSPGMPIARTIIIKGRQQYKGTSIYSSTPFSLMRYKDAIKSFTLTSSYAFIKSRSNSIQKKSKTL